MKRLLIIAACAISSITAPAFGQTGEAQNPTEQLLATYYNLKNALVAGDAGTAATNAQSFLKTANSIDYKQISEGNIAILVKDAGAISETKDLKKQRAVFANLSTNLATIAKTVKLSEAPIYKQYCPMQNACWLSNEQAIKNPYFGNSMLTCGNVTETIK